MVWVADSVQPLLAVDLEGELHLWELHFWEVDSQLFISLYDLD